MDRLACLLCKVFNKSWTAISDAVSYAYSRLQTGTNRIYALHAKHNRVQKMTKFLSEEFIPQIKIATDLIDSFGKFSTESNFITLANDDAVWSGFYRKTRTEVFVFVSDPIFRKEEISSGKIYKIATDGYQLSKLSTYLNMDVLQSLLDRDIGKAKFLEYLFSGDDEIRMEARGNDRFLIKGMAGDDRITVETGLSRIDGGIGNDKIAASDGRFYGREGDDVITASKGGFAWGGVGNDTIKGVDNAYGGGGNDRIAGVETALGAAGHDRIVDSYYAFGNAGDDILLNVYHGRGGKGDDLIETRGGPMYGDAGNDTLISAASGIYAGTDVSVFGGDGRDTLIVQKGSATLIGGAGADTFVIASSRGYIQILGFETRVSGERIDLSAYRSIAGFSDLMDNHVEALDRWDGYPRGAVEISVRGEGKDATKVDIRLLGVGLNQLSADDFIF